jgi:hypothetical protein
LLGVYAGALDDPLAEAMLLVARTEELVLDPVYTGRAMARLIAATAQSAPASAPSSSTPVAYPDCRPPTALARAAAAPPTGSLGARCIRATWEA